MKSKLTRPALIMMYGNPGSGKSFFARQASDLLATPHISADRIRYELFERPTFSKEEYYVIFNLMIMMAEEFIKAGLPVFFDISVNRLADRKLIREMAKKYNIPALIVWMQTDIDTCFERASQRDKRRLDDKYSAEMNPQQFDFAVNSMQAPNNEDYIVLSGKHLFNAQGVTFIRKLRELGLVSDESLGKSVPRPDMVNLVSRARAEAGRVDHGRRNVIIR